MYIIIMKITYYGSSEIYIHGSCEIYIYYGSPEIYIHGSCEICIVIGQRDPRDNELSKDEEEELEKSM